MITFRAWEFYGYEEEGSPSTALDEDKSSCDGLLSQGGALKDENLNRSSNRLDRVVLAKHLPQIPDNDHAFESFHVHAERGIFGGRHDGAIVHWPLRQTPSVTIPSANTLRGHKGVVLTLDFASDLGPEGLLFSGSADHSIKIWDPWGGLLSTKRCFACVQTLMEHGGSVICLQVLTQLNHVLISCSLDNTVRTWYPVEDCASSLYPRYIPAQSIPQSGSGWPSSVCVRCSVNGTLFVGDSSGCISMYTDSTALERVGNKQSSGQAKAMVQFDLKRKFSHFHSLGISSLQLIAENCYVVSLGFDEKAQILDAISGARSSTISNASAARFVSCAWNDRDKILLLSDVAGYVHLWNIFEDKFLGKKQPVSTSPLTIVGIYSLTTAAGNFVLMGLANGMKQWRCHRNAGYIECNSHYDGVVAIAVMANDISSFTEEISDRAIQGHESDAAIKLTSTCQFFSAALDGSIRCWDSYDMKVALGFEEKRSEISCMVASKQFHLIFTGHVDGIVKVWSIHAGELLALAVDKRCAVTCLAVGVVRDQEMLFVGSNDGDLWIWKINHDCILQAAPFNAALQDEEKGEVTSLVFCKGSFLAQEGQELIVIGFSTGQIIIRSLATKDVLCSFKGHSDSVRSLVTHGCFLFSSSEDLLLRMWNMFNPSDTYELGVLCPPSSSCSSSGSGSPIVCLDVVPSRGLLLSAAADGTLFVWNYSSFEDEKALDAFGKIVFRAKVDGCVTCLQCWPQRKALICGTAEGKVLVFDLPPKVGKLHALIKAKHLEEKIQVVITSPLTRAIETTIGAFPNAKIPIIVEPLCREMLDTSCDIGRAPSDLAQQFRSETNIDFSTLDAAWWLDTKKFPRSEPDNALPASILAPKTPDEVLPLRETKEELDARIRDFVAKLAERPEQHIAIVGHSAFFKRMLAMSCKLDNCELYETSFDTIYIRYAK